MTDYYPLIKKAISATDKSQPVRLAVYEKVRAAMLKVQAPVLSDIRLQTEERDLDEATPVLPKATSTVAPALHVTAK